MTTTPEERLAENLAKRDRELEMADLARYLAEAEAAMAKVRRIVDAVTEREATR